MIGKFSALLLVFLSLGFAIHSEAPDTLFQFEITYSTTFTWNHVKEQIGAGHLIKDKHDLLILRDSTGFGIYEFSGDNWQFMLNISHKQAPSHYGHPSLWTVGDLNNNGLDEIITWVDSSIITFEWDEKKFVKDQNYFAL